jgi:hypothetical protein
MQPLYLTRIEDFGRGDVVKVNCAACHHVALLTPDFPLRLGLSSSAKVLDLKGRVILFRYRRSRWKMAGRSAMNRYLFALAFSVVFASTASAVEVYRWTYDDVQIAKICGKNVACAEWARNILYEQCDAHRVDKKWFNPDFIRGDTRVFATVEECRHMWVDDLPNTPAVRSWRFRQNTPEENRMIGILN